MLVVRIIEAEKDIIHEILCSYILFFPQSFNYEPKTFFKIHSGDKHSLLIDIKTTHKQEKKKSQSDINCLLIFIIYFSTLTIGIFRIILRKQCLGVLIFLSPPFCCLCCYLYHHIWHCGGYNTDITTIPDPPPPSPPSCISTTISISASLPLSISLPCHFRHFHPCATTLFWCLHSPTPPQPLLVAHTIIRLLTAKLMADMYEWASLTLSQVCLRAYHGGAMCVPNYDDSRGPAIRTAYRISLRSSSWWQPRHPLL